MKDLLFQLRAELGISALTASDFIGVHKKVWMAWEDGRANVPIEWLPIIKRKFKLSWTVIGHAIAAQFPPTETHKKLKSEYQQNELPPFLVRRQRERSKLRKRKAMLDKASLKKRSELMKMLIDDKENSVLPKKHKKKMPTIDAVQELLHETSVDSETAQKEPKTGDSDE